MSYTKVEWKTGEVVKPAHVTINGVEHNITPEERTGATPINVSNLNNMDDGIYENNLNITKTNENISSAYDSTKTYKIGDYSIHNNELYRCSTTIGAAEEFDETKWEKVNVTNEMKTQIVLNQEMKTTQVIDEKHVYVKRYKINALPNNAIGYTDHNLDLTELTIVDFDGMATNGDSFIKMSYYNPKSVSSSLGLYVNATSIAVTTAANLSSYWAYVNLYYMKNNEV